MPESELKNLVPHPPPPPHMPQPAPSFSQPDMGPPMQESNPARVGDMPPPAFSTDTPPVFRMDPVPQGQEETTLKVAKGLKAFLLERSLRKTQGPDQAEIQNTGPAIRGIAEDDPYARLLRPLTTSELGYLKEEVSREEIIFDRWNRHQRRAGFLSQFGGVVGLALFCLLLWRSGKHYLKDLSKGLPQPSWFDQLPDYQEQILLAGAIIAPIVLLILMMSAGSNLLRAAISLGRLQFLVRGILLTIGSVVMVIALHDRLIITALIIGLSFWLLSKLSSLIVRLINHGGKHG